MTDPKTIARKNFEALRVNPYPGRGIILGASGDNKTLIQVYWIMGRSENSRNRIFVAEGSAMRTKAFDEAKLTDPSLVIYYPVRVIGGVHIVTNGDQTDTICEALAAGCSFESALEMRTFEPDAPNFTPRISGIMDLHALSDYTLSILKSAGNNPDFTLRQTFGYEKAMPGCGHCITTYAGDGNPLPSFLGEPFLLPLDGSIDEIADTYWEALNAENKVALMVKGIDRASGIASMVLRNKHLGD